jgi:hypothetical protein
MTNTTRLKDLNQVERPEPDAVDELEARRK